MTYNIFACEQNFLCKYLSDIYTEVIDIKKIESGWIEFSKKEKSIYTVNGDIAEISISGVLLNGELPLIAMLLGYQATSYQEIAASIRAVSDDDSINTVKLIMDTPGGDVHGVDEVRNLVEALCGKKRVQAINTGMIASAGYWIASAADEIVSTSPVNETGSIGVVITQYVEDDPGYKKIKIVSRNAENKQPDATTSKGLDILQARADAIERVFIQRVAEGRGISVENVIDKFGKGDLLISNDPDPEKTDALSVGMIDAIIDVSGNRITKQGVVMGTDVKSENQILSISEALSKYPNLQAELDSELKKSYDRGVDSASKEAKELRDRYSAVAIYLKSEAYPQSIKNIAYDVLEGKVSTDMLRGAVVMYDAMQCKEKVDAAVADTEQVGSTYSKTEIKKDAHVISDSDEDRIVAEMKGGR